MQYVVLLSAGLDSTVNLHAAHKRGEVVRALTFDYGQRAAPREIARSKEICATLGVQHEVIDLSWLKSITKTSLVNTSAQVPTSTVQIDDLKASEETARAVWVPNRNGVLLNIAAAYAESFGADAVVPGFNREEATTFPDNSKAYISALNQSFGLSTMSKVKVECFTTDMDKSEIVKLGRELGVPFELMWPCYFAGEKICGECESCRRFLRAME